MTPENALNLQQIDIKLVLVKKDKGLTVDGYSVSIKDSSGSLSSCSSFCSNFSRASLLISESSFSFSSRVTKTEKLKTLIKILLFNQYNRIQKIYHHIDDRDFNAKQKRQIYFLNSKFDRQTLYSRFIFGNKQELKPSQKYRQTYRASNKS